MTSDWLFWIGGGLLGLAGLWLCYWAMFANRAKGRKRCPKCWYNMQAAENLRCPECGKTVKTKRKLLKTRRRWRWAFVAVLLMLGSYTLELVPRYRTSDWRENSSTSLLVLHAYLFDDSESFSIVHLRSGTFRVPYSTHYYFAKEENLYSWQWRVMMSYVLLQLGKFPDDLPNPEIYFFLSGGPPNTKLATEYISTLLEDSTDEEASEFISMLDHTISLRALSPSEIEQWIRSLTRTLARVITQSQQKIVRVLSSYGYESVIAIPQLLELLLEEDDAIHEYDDALREIVAGTIGDMVARPHLNWWAFGDDNWDVFEDDKYKTEYDARITDLHSQAVTSLVEITNALTNVLESDNSEEVQLAAAISLCQLDAGSPLAHRVIIDYLTRPEETHHYIIVNRLSSFSEQSKFLLPSLEYITNNQQDYSKYIYDGAKELKKGILESDSP